MVSTVLSDREQEFPTSRNNNFGKEAKGNAQFWFRNDSFLAFFPFFRRGACASCLIVGSSARETGERGVLSRSTGVASVAGNSRKSWFGGFETVI